MQMLMNVRAWPLTIVTSMLLAMIPLEVLNAIAEMVSVGMELTVVVCYYDHQGLQNNRKYNYRL